MSNDNWTDEECRYFFHLWNDEKKKGNKGKNGMNQTGKEFIMMKFEERFGRGYLKWDRFKNKYDTSKKSYVKFQRLIHNRTGLGYDSMGRLDIPPQWWDELKKEWPGSVKYKNNLPANMDVLDEEFGCVTVTGAEGWSAQQGEASLNSRVDERLEYGKQNGGFWIVSTPNMV